MDDYIAERLTKSTAARTDAPNQNADGHGAVNATEAGTQAPPIDTLTRNQRAQLAQTERIVSAMRQSGEMGAAVERVASRPRGRPKTITDMKAYKAKKEHDRRDRIRAAKAAKEPK